MDIRTDISIYRVTLLLKKLIITFVIESVVPKNLFGGWGNLIPLGPRLFVSEEIRELIIIELRIKRKLIKIILTFFTFWKYTTNKFVDKKQFKL